MLLTPVDMEGVRWDTRRGKEQVDTTYLLTAMPKPLDALQSRKERFARKPYVSCQTISDEV